jgi:phage terminase large subunit-like protein
MERRIAAKIQHRTDRNRIRAYRPYTKQMEFHAAGKDFVDRLLLAGNQNGKTYCGGAEVTLHATGRYPDWWPGCSFDSQVDMWVAGVTNESTRDVVQKTLVGPPEKKDQWGTGFIPADAIVETKPARGIANLLDYIVVRHGGGGDVQAGQSVIGFKSYEQGRESWQGPPKDFVWFDEEPPEDIHTEGRARTQTKGRRSMMTFTPLQGMSTVVAGFVLKRPEEIALIGRKVINMTIHDAEHYTSEERAAIIAGYPEHEREARALGVPTIGSGRIFPVKEEDIACAPIEIPASWARLGGMDFGWDHPFAAVELAWDRDTDTVYVTKAHRVAKQTPIFHCAALKPWNGSGDQWLPWAWPRDGRRETLEGAGIALARQYGDQGLKMLQIHAQFEDGSVSVEAGLMEMLDRMNSGRLKVFANLTDWFEEFRLYHRKKGLVVKERDDLMAATRYAIMMLRFAKTKPKPKGAYPPASGGGWQAM